MVRPAGARQSRQPPARAPKKRRPLKSRPPPSPRTHNLYNTGYGFYTAVSPTEATWTFKTVKPDNGAADYADRLTIVKQ